jgi:crotonobetainyl-CoA:carnitine CoA-transferase CaiB-like acyl-CoA transferase
LRRPQLNDAISVGTVRVVGVEPEAWSGAGLAALTGRADGPPCRPPDEVVAAIGALVAGAPVGDPLALLGERAARAGTTRRSPASCGGTTRLLPASDGWLAVALPREDDRVAVPAWLEVDAAPDDPWALVREEVAGRPTAALVGRAALLGLPVAAVAERAPGPPVRFTEVAPAPPLADAPLVVDLSALWAGPLCSHLLQLQGARVVKVESVGRPDGARADDTGFFDLLNHGKASVALDLAGPDLRSLLAAADVVIEGSRPRALRQLGLDAEALLGGRGPRVWVSITGHGRADPMAQRVGFGDDTAAAGGLVLLDERGPVFVADAVADPLAGIVAAAAVTERLAAGGTWLLDVSLAGVAAAAAVPEPRAVPVADAPPPRSRPVAGPAPALGADTATVLARLA